jgi:uncharacterized protein with HEPN domain
LGAIEKIDRYVAGLDHDAFIRDYKTIDSVVRNLEIIGEAANRLPENFKAQRSEIEWRQIIGLRNRIVHAYFNIDVEIVWEIHPEGLAEPQIKGFAHPHVTDGLHFSHFRNSGNLEVWPNKIRDHDAVSF